MTLSVNGALSTVNSELEAEYERLGLRKGRSEVQQAEVLCRTLNRILEEHEIAPGFDVLSVDVESCETEDFAALILLLTCRRSCSPN